MQVKPASLSATLPSKQPIPKLALPGSRYCVLLYINGVLGKESHSLPIDYNYVIRASETMIIDWQCIAFPIPFRKVINL